MMRTGGLVLPHRRYSMPEAVMRKYRLHQRMDSLSSDSSSEDGARAVDRGSQTTPRDSWRTVSFPSLATPSPRALSSTVPSDCQTVSDKTVSTQDSTLSVPSSNSNNSCPAQSMGEDVEMQVSFPELQNQSSSVAEVRNRSSNSIIEVAVNVEADMLDDRDLINNKKDEGVQVKDIHRSIACQVEESPLFTIPYVTILKETNESQNRLALTKEVCSQVSKKDILQETDPFSFHIRRIRAEIACARGNYDDYPVENPVVPRYTAVPRSNSMLVNRSSVDYSSDSELSLVDSLEDPEEYRVEKWRQSRHDERLVRGEVRLEQERRGRLPKGRDAYAYFLSLNGEEDTIREYTVPDWLRKRLRRREEEIRKVYENKFSRYQQVSMYRRRKKTFKRIKLQTPYSYSSNEKIKKNEIIISDSHPKHEKTDHVNYDEKSNINNYNAEPSTSDKCSLRLINGNNMGVEPKIDNVHRNKNVPNLIHNNNNPNNNNGVPNKLFVESESGNRMDTSLLQISEIIKIDISNNQRTVITKEKKINLPSENNIIQNGHKIVTNELTNSSKIISSQGNKAHVTAELEETNVVKSSRQFPQNDAERIYTQGEKGYSKEVSAKETSNCLTKNWTTFDNVTKDPKNNDTGTAVIAKGDASNISLDRKIANILINALEENTKAHKLCGKSNEQAATENVNETKIESYSKILVHQNGSGPSEEAQGKLGRCSSVEVQTDDMINEKDQSPNKKILFDKSCITEPYFVSVIIQTSDDQSNSNDVQTENFSYHEFKEYEDSINQQDDIVTSFESITKGNVTMVDKACNTVEIRSISTQTNESILQSLDLLNSVKKNKTSKKKDVQFPPQVIKQIITGTGEYKTVEDNNDKVKDKEKANNSTSRRGKVSKGTNTDEESMTECNKNVVNNNNNTEVISNRCHPTPFCKNSFPNKTNQRKTQVLELNVPACTCHMCTLQKISPRAENPKTRISQSMKLTEVVKDDRKTSSKPISRRNIPMGTKFPMFEVIPEEKTSSNESVPEENKQEKRSKIEREEKGIVTEPHLVDELVQVSSQIESVATNTEPLGSDRDLIREEERGTQTEKREETSQGRQHKASSNLVIGRFRSESCKETPLHRRQYKGRASLSAGHHEELLTLSRGWINFYLLKDNFDLSDSNNEDSPSVSRRRDFNRSEEGQVEEYTLEIKATPEPRRNFLPNLKQSSGTQTGGGLLDITRSGSSSPAASPAEERHKQSVDTLPGVRKTKSVNVQKDIDRTRRRDEPVSRAVEVARSEQSVSSITSSTVIMSESPPPQKHRLPDKKSSQRKAHRPLKLTNGSSWTVTVAGSSGAGNEPPPDVEMRLSFAKRDIKQEESLQKYHEPRHKRQDCCSANTLMDEEDENLDALALEEMDSEEEDEV